MIALSVIILVISVFHFIKEIFQVCIPCNCGISTICNVSNSNVSDIETRAAGKSLYRVHRKNNATTEFLKKSSLFFAHKI